MHKRKGARNIRLVVDHNGSIKVTMPAWTPYRTAVAFVISKQQWIEQQKVGRQNTLLKDGERIGKAHRIIIVPEARTNVTARVAKTNLTIRIPLNMRVDDKEVQRIGLAGAIRALKQEARALLPQRLNALATQHGFIYKSVSIKHLKTRWGSCSSQKDIALNCFLMQLPWDIIDYVLLHELLHTRIMAHGPVFWRELNKFVPNLTDKRKLIKTHKPMLMPQ